MSQETHTQTQSQRHRHRLWRLVRMMPSRWRWCCCLPYLLVPLYRVVDPVSTLMLGAGDGRRVARSKVPLERMAPVLPATIIASEMAFLHPPRRLGVIRDAIEEADDLQRSRRRLDHYQQLAKTFPVGRAS